MSRHIPWFGDDTSPLEDEGDWNVGDRVQVELPGGYRGGRFWMTGVVTGLDEPGLPRGVRVALDVPVRGSDNCYATHSELRPYTPSPDQPFVNPASTGTREELVSSCGHGWLYMRRNVTFHDHRPEAGWSWESCDSPPERSAGTGEQGSSE